MMHWMSRPAPRGERAKTRHGRRLMIKAIASLLSLALILAPTLRPILAEPLAASYVSADLGRATRIQMGAGKTVLFDLPRDATEIVVGNPAVVNAVVRTPRKIYLMGAGLGQTTVFALDVQLTSALPISRSASVATWASSRRSCARPSPIPRSPYARSAIR